MQGGQRQQRGVSHFPRKIDLRERPAEHLIAREAGQVDEALVDLHVAEVGEPGTPRQGLGFARNMLSNRSSAS